MVEEKIFNEKTQVAPTKKLAEPIEPKPSRKEDSPTENFISFICRSRNLTMHKMCRMRGCKCRCHTTQAPQQMPAKKMVMAVSMAA